MTCTTSTRCGSRPAPTGRTWPIPIWRCSGTSRSRNTPTLITARRSRTRWWWLPAWWWTRCTSATGSGAGPHRSSSGRTCRTCCAASSAISIRPASRPGPHGTPPCRPAPWWLAMPDVSFTNLLLVVAVAVAAPLCVGYLPRLRVPAVVLEIVGGIIIGPSVLGWVHVDLPVPILPLFGLAFLLFLAGLELDVHRLRD